MALCILLRGRRPEAEGNGNDERNFLYYTAIRHVFLV